MPGEKNEFVGSHLQIDRKKLEQDTSQYHSINPNHRHPLPSSRSTSMLDRLNAEITIHHQVKHQNIVELLNCFFDEKYVYLILEYCSRGDLEHYLKEKKTLTEHESKSIDVDHAKIAFIHFV